MLPLPPTTARAIGAAAADLSNAAAQAALAPYRNTGKQVWVDSVNGNDATGARARRDKPFLTLAAAKAAAVSGDLIQVGPGDYVVSGSIAKSGVNWHFSSGASVLLEDGTESGLWDDGATQMVFDVTGDGVFTRHATAESLLGSIARITHASSRVTIQCKRIDVSAEALALNGATVVDQRGGYISVVTDEIIGGAGVNHLTWWYNGEQHFTASRISVTGYVGYALVEDTPTGGCYITADYISGAWIASESGLHEDAVTWVRAAEIVANLTPHSVIEGNGPGKVYVTCQKAWGVVNCAADGKFYLNTDKLSPVADAQEIIKHSSGYLLARVGIYDPGAFLAPKITISGGVADIEGGIFRGGAGVTVSGGVAGLRNLVVDTSVNAAANPITKSGGTLILHDVTLVAEATRKCIEVPSAQTVKVYSAFANTAVSTAFVVTQQVGTVTVSANVG